MSLRSFVKFVASSALPPCRRLLEAVATYESEIGSLKAQLAACKDQLPAAHEEAQTQPTGTIFKIDNRLVLTNPTPQTALDIFKGTWISQLPGEFSRYEAGKASLFEDQRIPQCAESSNT